MFLKNSRDMPSCFECSVFKYVAKCDGFIYPLSIISKHGSKLRRVTLQIMGVNSYFKQSLPIFCFFSTSHLIGWPLFSFITCLANTTHSRKGSIPLLPFGYLYLNFSIIFNTWLL